MTAPHRSRLRTAAILLAAALVAALAVTSVVVVQNRAARKHDSTDLVGELAVALYRVEGQAVEGDRGAALRELRAQVPPKLERAIRLDGDPDLRPLTVLVRDFELALQTATSAAGDRELSAALFRRRVRPAFERLEQGVANAYGRERVESDYVRRSANAQSAWTLALALLVAGLLFWRFRAARNALREVTRFRRFAEHAADSLFLIDQDGRIAETNRAASIAHGYGRDELMGMPIAAIVPTMSPDYLGTLFTTARSEPVTVTARHRRRDGSEFPVETRIGVLREDGRRLLLAFARDISAREEAERQVRFQAQLLDQVDAAVIAVANDGTITHWSLGAERLLGWSEDDLLGTDIEQVPFVGDRARERIRDVRRHVREGEIWHGEMPMTRRDGSRFPVLVTAGPVHASDGSVVGAVTVTVDLTDQKRAATELGRRAVQQAALADLGRRAIAGAGSQALMQQAVDLLAELLDAPEAAVLELQPGGRELVLRAGSGKAREHEGVLRVPADDDGLAAYVLGSDGPVIVDDLTQDGRFRPPERLVQRGATSGIVTVVAGSDAPFGILRAFSHRRRAFTPDDVSFTEAMANVLAAALTSEREGHLLDQLERARRLESIGVLAGGVAHDFNNLLAVISNFADFARADVEPGSQADGDIGEIQRAAARAGDLTRQLLQFSRRETVEARVVDVNAAIAETESMLRRTIGEHITLRSRCAADVWQTRAGAGQLEQVLVNLAVNARDAMPDGGTLEITTENVEVGPGSGAEAPADLPPGRWVRVTVSDTGTGMPEEVASQAFEPFFTTKPTGKGTGLGLATVYGIVSGAGGEVRIDTVPGSGTTISIYLPASEEVAAPGATPNRESKPNGRGETILVVEDEEQVRSLTSRILTRQGYAALEASDGDEALAVAAGHDGHIDLLVTDVVMPGISGAELAERLLASRPDTKVLYMSGYTGDVVLRHGPRDSAAGVLEKPFSADALLEAVAASLAEGAPA